MPGSGEPVSEGDVLEMKRIMRKLGARESATSGEVAFLRGTHLYALEAIAASETADLAESRRSAGGHRLWSRARARLDELLGSAGSGSTVRGTRERGW